MTRIPAGRGHPTPRRRRLVWDYRDRKSHLICSAEGLTPAVVLSPYAVTEGPCGRSTLTRTIVRCRLKGT